MTKIIRNKFSSLNFDDRTNVLIDMIVIHSTHMPFMESVQRLCDPNIKVSSHYIIDLDGSVYQLVDEENRAWHAGISHWRGRNELNDYSIGIELVDTDDKLSRVHSFTSTQIDSIVNLCSKIIERYKIKPYNIVAHSDIAPSRKDDPGEGFDWRFLAKQGIGIYHDIDIQEHGKTIVAEYQDRSSVVRNIQRLLSSCGYQIEVNGFFDDNMKDVVIAFKRHFYSERMDDICDVNFQRILENIASKFK